MNNRITTKALTEGAILASITALLGIISYYIPFLTLLIFIWPVPIIILGKRHGLSVSILASLSAGLILSLSTPLLYSIPIVLMYGTLGVVLGYGYNKEFSPLKYILSGYLVSLLSTIILLQFYSMFTGINIVTEISQTMRMTMEEVNRLYQGMGMDQNTLNNTIKQMDQIIEQMGRLFPATLILIPIVVTMINAITSGKILKRLGHNIVGLPPFRDWRLPNHAGVGLFLTLTLVVIGQYANLPSFDLVYQNLLYLTFILFTVQGLSFVIYYLYKKGVSKAIVVVSIIMVFIFPLVHTLVQLIGIIDVIFNLRDKINPQKG